MTTLVTLSGVEEFWQYEGFRLHLILIFEIDIDF